MAVGVVTTAVSDPDLPAPQQGQSDGIANTVTSQQNTVRLDGLTANSMYVVQVRARTVAGYGQYSLPVEFQTPAEDGMCWDWNPFLLPSHGPAQPLVLISLLCLPQAPAGRASRSCP